MLLTTTRSGYLSDGTQVASGQFLLLLNKGEEYRATVRRVSLKQLGPWMMGTARIFGYSLIVSGAYGSDGLPIDCETDRPYGTAYVTSSIGVKDEVKSAQKKQALDRLWDSSIPVPQELTNAWKNGGGWNSAGNEASEMRKWARANLLTRN